ncbi:nitrous oxidase accessory protein [Nitratiruptor sp. YY08-14]|nr:nitrous oxidase accessory protein [Nitratiruptor sp. YY08-10]BCD63293.1 nitrous oxidase accessory protein [Nitratiruptor sp. YY08-14]
MNPMVIRYLFLLSTILSWCYSAVLQNAINNAKPSSIINISNGTFHETIIIDKPLTIKAKNCTIEGTKKGSVITIKSSNVHISGMHIKGSGDRRDTMDAAVVMEGVGNVTIKNCTIDNSLFGIVAHYSSNLVFKNNSIASFPEKVVDNRGDFIRLWGCNNVLIQNNHLFQGRDLSINRSNNILIQNNQIEHARYGILAMMDHNLTASLNKIFDMYAGIYLKGGAQISLIHNTIFDTRLATGTGILLSHGKKIFVRHNRIFACAQGVYIDSSPAEIGMRRYIEHNIFSNNFTALHFHSAICNNTITNNDFLGNLNDVVRDLSKIKKANNIIEKNYWDRYQGFDQNKDGFGDIPYQILLYADRLWQNDHHLQFFYATPIFSLLDFIERLAPFSEPEKLLKDRLPRMEPVNH